MIDKSLYCETHLLSAVGRDNHGSIYQRCWQGKKNADRGVDQKCVIKAVEEHTADHQIMENNCTVCDYKEGGMKNEIV